MRVMERGESFALVAKALVNANGSISELQREAEFYRHDYPEVHAYLKAAVSAGTTTDANFAGPLAQYAAIGNDFLELVRTRTIIGRLPEAQRMPLNTRASLEGPLALVYWTAQGAPKPVSRMVFTEMGSLQPRKCSIIVVLTDELTRGIGGTRAITAALVRHLAAGLDRALLDPSFGSSSAAPTSVTSGGTVVSPTGTTALLIAADLKSLAVSVGAGSEFDSPVFVLSPLTAAKLAAVRDTAGGPAFPFVNAQTGGSLIGIPVLISNGTQSADSPSDDNIVLLNASSLIIADDNQVSVGVSTEATLQMDSAPGAGAQTGINMFQMDMVAIRVERPINWTTTRAGAAASLRVTF